MRGLLIVVVAVATVSAQTRDRVSPADYLTHVKFLASDELGGRGYGTSYFQSFDADVRVEPPAATTLTIVSPGVDSSSQVLTLGTSYYPLSVIDRRGGLPPPLLQDVPIVFAGYGISAPGTGYDDLPGSTCAMRQWWSSRTNRRKRMREACSTAPISRRARRSRSKRRKRAAAAHEC